MKSLYPVIIAGLLASGCTSPEKHNDAVVAVSVKPQLGTFGFDTKGMASSIKPGNDFYKYANGHWDNITSIPDDKSNFGMFSVLADLSDKRVKGILEEAGNVGDSKIGLAFSSYLNHELVEKKGLTPIKPWLQEIDDINALSEYMQILVKASRMGIDSLFYGYIDQDNKNPNEYIFKIYQGGLGLPDRDMYLVDNEKYTAIRTDYVAHLDKILAMTGAENTRERAEAIFAMEKKIAEVHWTREDSSDSTKTYNRMNLDALEKSTPDIAFTPVIKSFSPDIQEVIVLQPSAMEGISRIIANEDLTVLKDVLIVRSLDSCAHVLPDEIANENFAFYKKRLSGIPEQKARWKRGVTFVENALGEDIGKIYVEKYFPPETKAEMDKLVNNVLNAMGQRIDELKWMQSETKLKAKQKLKNFTVKIGYPDRWKDYSSLEIKQDDLFGNYIRANEWHFRDEMSKLGTPIRRWEWGMLPQTVNAYANFNMNEIVFPAAILQPPFFDPAADPAINYGSIGAVIGHEISHHFDDQGAKYDEKGQMRDWWTDKDIAEFEQAGKALIAQYNAYEPLPGEFIKGEYTLGENIGDLAGVTVALTAYHNSLKGKNAPVLEGFTGDQRFFLGWAQSWRRKYREEELSKRLITDPHSPSIQRAWVVRNIDEWYEAFNIRPSDELYLSPEKRVKIW